MSGWKTKIAAFLSVAYGVFGIFAGLHDSSEGVQFVVNGLALIGIGHKIEKSKA